MRLLLIIMLTVLPKAEGMLVITGASTEEDLDESVVERFESFRRHPLPINTCTRSRLLSSGLFTRFQIASLLDYRSRSGDILSFVELAAVDGFNGRYAEALKEFVTLEGGRSGPVKDSVFHSVMVRAAVRKPEEKTEYAGGFKYRMEWGDRLEFNWSDRTTYSSPRPGWGTMNLGIYGRRALGKVVVGDFNARFGQGLLVWNGFSMSGVPSARAVYRNGTGISASRSFSEGLHGIGADFNIGKYMLSAAYDRRHRVLANLSRIGKTWQAGLTAYFSEGRLAASADWRAGFNGGAVFGEAALDGGVPACLAGAFFVPRYGSMVSAALRYYPSSYSGEMAGALRSSSKVSDEAGLSLAAQNGWGLVTFDSAWHLSKSKGTLKALAQIKNPFVLGNISFTPALRISERCSLDAGGGTQWRSDVRMQMDLVLGPWLASSRYNAVRCREWGWLWYGEIGYKREYGPHNRISMYIRGEIYRADNWDDRIYVYERDAPGNFNVPAYYGSGWNLSLVSSWKTGHHTVSLRVSTFRREAKIQYSIDL